MSVAALSLQGLGKRYGETQALERVSLEVAQGQLLALLGPSGCGKTTLLRLVAGLLEPDEGEIKLNTRDVAHLPPEKRELGMVFQRPTLFPPPKRSCECRLWSQDARCAPLRGSNARGGSAGGCATHGF